MTHPAGRRTAMSTGLTQAQADTAVRLALLLTDDVDRAHALVMEVDRAAWSKPAGTIGALAMMVTTDRTTPPPTAAQVRMVAERVAALSHQAGYEAGVTAALRARLDGSDTVGNVYAAARAREVDMYAHRAELLHAAMGRPAGYEYRGGPVEWEPEPGTQAAEHDP